MFPRYISGLCFPLPILRILLFASSNSMWYLFAMLCVIFSIACSSSVSDDTSDTSSIHRRHPVHCCRLSNFDPSLCFCISLFISSIMNAYCITDSTPPCLMLSLMLILRVSPYLVLSLAVEFVLRSFIICHRSSGVPSLSQMTALQQHWGEYVYQVYCQ